MCVYKYKSLLVCPYANTRILTRTRLNPHVYALTSRHACSEMCLLRVRTCMHEGLRHAAYNHATTTSRDCALVALPVGSLFLFMARTHIARNTHGEGGGSRVGDIEEALGVMLTRRGSIGRVASFARCSAQPTYLDWLAMRRCDMRLTTATRRIHR